jgi:polar amino acid transport system substrate-binding protein
MLLQLTLTGLAFATALATAASAWAGETFDRVMEARELVVSTDPAYPPQSVQKPGGSFQGFDIDVATEIAKRLGAKVKFVTPAWEVIAAGRWGGRWDVSVGSMTPTKARAEVLDFPAIYYYTPAAFAVHKDNVTQSVSDLSGKRIGVCGACTYEGYLKGSLVIDAEHVPPFTYQVSKPDIRTYVTDTNAFDDLKLGDGVRLDAVMLALPTIQEAINHGYPFRVVGKPVFFEPLSVATDKGDLDFDAKVAEIVKTMHADGALKNLSVKWYGIDLTSTD